MDALAGISAFGQGAMQGMGAAQQLRSAAIDLQQKQMQLDTQKRQLAAAAARFHGIDGGQQQSPGMPGAQPMPNAQPPAPPAMPPQVPGPQGMGGPPPSGPAPMGPGQGGGQPPALSGIAAPTGNPVQDMMNTWRSIAMDIKRRNPQIDDLTLSDAVEEQIAQLKQLDPSERAFLQSQTAYYKAGVDLMKGNIAAESRRDVADIGAKSREDVANTQAGARRYSADQSRAASDTRAASGFEGRKYAADRGAESREAVADTQAGASRYRADSAAGASNYRADQAARASASKAYLQAVTQGGTVQPTAEQLATADAISKGGSAMAKKATSRPANRPQMKPTSPYKSAADVAAAYKAGKLPRDQAEAILRANGWAQ